MQKVEVKYAQRMGVTAKDYAMKQELCQAQKYSRKSETWLFRVSFDCNAITVECDAVDARIAKLRKMSHGILNRWGPWKLVFIC